MRRVELSDPFNTHDGLQARLRGLFCKSPCELEFREIEPGVSQAIISGGTATHREIWVRTTDAAINLFYKLEAYALRRLEDD